MRKTLSQRGFGRILKGSSPSMTSVPNEPSRPSPKALALFWAVIGGIDPSSDVRLEAASWLGSFEIYREDSVAALVTALEDPDWWVALRACRGIEELGKNASTAVGAVRSVYERNVHLPGDGAMFLAFSSSAFLKEMGEPIRPWDFSKEPAAEKP